MRAAGLAASAAVAAAALGAHAVDVSEEGFMFSGYGCDRSCDQGDVNYEIEARLETFTVSGATADAVQGGPPDSPWTGDASAFTRTFVGRKGPFCDGNDGTEGMVGPCLQVKPGQLLTVKLINNMDNGMQLLDQQKASKPGYWEQTQKGPNFPDFDPIGFPSNASFDDTQNLPNDNAESGWLNEPANKPGDMNLTSMQNFPGWDTSFDNTNLHFHGMQVVPHLFFPQGTNNPSAQWIQTIPGDAEQTCFCYAIQVPEDHPEGQFWYHIHRHGAVAMQGWQGLVGELLVTGSNDPESQLASQGVTLSAPAVVWEWVVDSNRVVDGTDATFYEANFIDGGGDLAFIPVNNEVKPTIATMPVGETLHLRTLSAQTTTGIAIEFVDDDGEVYPFYRFAADGIMWEDTIEATMVVMGPGQREALLVQFPEPGKYTMQGYLMNDFQNQGAGPDGNALAVYPPGAFELGYIEVTSERVDPVDLSALTFTPGMPASSDIQPQQITGELSVNFQVNSDLTKLPIPQFVIDSKGFNVYQTNRAVVQGTATQWQVSSDMNYFHPFHIHVNPFQVKTMSSGQLFGPEKFVNAVFDTNLAKRNMWRDTMFIPPFGIITFWQKFAGNSSDGVQLSGKTVFHCHFLDHEDQGMISSFLIEKE
jgi:FtsP/CotA-like multicopper oxidase with cupredoxin domain